MLSSLYPLIEAILINQLYHMEVKRGAVPGGCDLPANPQESSCRTCGWPNETKPSYVLPKYRTCFWYTALAPKIWLLEKCWIFVVQSPIKLINRCKWLQAATLHDIPMQVTAMEKWKFPIPMLDRNKVRSLSPDQGFWLPGLFDLDNFQAELLDVRMKDLQTVSDGQNETQHFKCNRPLVSKTKNAVVQKKLMHKREKKLRQWISFEHPGSCICL